jgi:hypothetical protein
LGSEIMGAAIGGFVGSLASQIVGKGMGVVDDISLRSAFASGITAGITTGVGEALKATDISWLKTATTAAGKDVLTAGGKFVMGATRYAGSYVANKIVGLEAHFDWKDLAIQTLSSVGSSYVNENVLNKGLIGNDIVRGTAQGIAGAALHGNMSREWSDGKKLDWGQVAADAFGNALANAFVAEIKRAEEDRLWREEQENLTRDAMWREENEELMHDTMEREKLEEELRVLEEPVRERLQKEEDARMAEPTVATAPSAALPRIPGTPDLIGLMDAVNDQPNYLLVAAGAAVGILDRAVEGFGDMAYNGWLRTAQDLNSLSFGMLFEAEAQEAALMGQQWGDTVVGYLSNPSTIVDAYSDSFSSALNQYNVLVAEGRDFDAGFALGNSVVGDTAVTVGSLGAAGSTKLLAGVGRGSTTPSGVGSDAGAMRRMEYEAAPYHGTVDNLTKSRAPINGQDALDLSVQVKPTSPRRVGIDYEVGDFAVFDQTRDGIFHGHARSWDDLHPDMQRALQQAGMVDRRGNILGAR